jgi:hypothetical protein
MFNAGHIYTQNYVGFQVLIAMVIKNTICWDMTSCSPLKII